MKKRLLMACCLFTIVSVFGFAQDSQKKNESYLYPKQIYIAKIYPHQLGYRIDYFRDDNTIGTLYAPISWFEGSAPKAKLGYGTGPCYPFMIAYYKEGKIDHINIYVFQDLAHLSWGYLSDELDLTDEFNVEEPVLTFYKDKK